MYNLWGYLGQIPVGPRHAHVKSVLIEEHPLCSRFHKAQFYCKNLVKWNTKEVMGEFATMCIGMIILDQLLDLLLVGLLCRDGHLSCQNAYCTFITLPFVRAPYIAAAYGLVILLHMV